MFLTATTAATEITCRRCDMWQTLCCSSTKKAHIRKLGWKRQRKKEEGKATASAFCYIFYFFFFPGTKLLWMAAAEQNDFLMIFPRSVSRQLLSRPSPSFYLACWKLINVTNFDPERAWQQGQKGRKQSSAFGSFSGADKGQKSSCRKAHHPLSPFLLRIPNGEEEEPAFPAQFGASTEMVFETVLSCGAILGPARLYQEARAFKSALPTASTSAVTAKDGKVLLQFAPNINKQLLWKTQLFIPPNSFDRKNLLKQRVSKRCQQTSNSSDLTEKISGKTKC